jgi:sugar phosphate isomerase/epimerase
MTQRPISLHHLTMLDADPGELVSLAAEAGYEHAGLRIISPDTGEPFGQLIESATARRDLRARTVDLPGGILDVEAVWLRPHTDVSRLVPALSTARDIGARHVLTVGHDPDRARLADNYGRLAELASSFGLQLAIEPITYCSIDNLLSARTLVEEVGRGDISILVDALQFFRSGVPLEELEQTPRDLLRYAQIADGPAVAPSTTDGLRHEARSERQVPGRGDFDLRGWLRALPAGTPLAVEVPSPTVRALPRPEAATMLRLAVEALLDQIDGVDRVDPARP